MLGRDTFRRALIHRAPNPAPPVKAHTAPQGQSGPRRGIRRGIRREIGQAAIQGLVVKLWVASMVRTVPERERITIEWVVAP